VFEALENPPGELVEIGCSTVSTVGLVDVVPVAGGRVAVDVSVQCDGELRRGAMCHHPFLSGGNGGPLPEGE